MTRRSIIVLAAALLAACGRSSPDAGTSGPTAAAPDSPVPAAQAAPTACALVTAVEMSRILGFDVAAEASEGSGTTTCTYRPRSRTTPFVEVKVDWGSGEAAMMATGFLGRLEPGIAAALEGVGDRAVAMGPALMIRTGDDLVTLTLFGIDETADVARRILLTMRPRMGPSSQPRDARTSGRDAAESPVRATREAEPVFEPIAPGSAPSIPLVPGLSIVTAFFHPGIGDHEAIATVTRMDRDGLELQVSFSMQDDRRFSVERFIRRDDLEAARTFRSWFFEDDPAVFEGTTALLTSSAVLADLKTAGSSDFGTVSESSGGTILDGLASLLGGPGGDGSGLTTRKGRLKRISPEPVGLPVLVNDRRVALPAIRAAGSMGGTDATFYVLDNPANPVVLRARMGDAALDVVRIAFPIATSAAVAAPASGAPIEDRLQDEGRVELHGIYFDFGKATIRAESEPVLREIADVMTSNRDWALHIEGHTDDIGGDAYNLDLSKRRAAAVRQWLIERRGIAAARLTTDGLGAAQPKESNETIAGRARNRRVELVRR